MQIIVTGSQTWEDQERVWTVLDTAYHLALRHGERLIVVHGAARRGADRFAARWVEWTEQWDSRAYEKRYPARWERFRKAAGMFRNRQMWTEEWHRTDLCVAFRWTGPSPGTDHCTSLAIEHSCPVWLVRPAPMPIPQIPYFRLRPEPRGEQ